MAIVQGTTKAVTSGGGATRKRIIYQSEALFANGNNINRVQSINYSFTVPRTDVNQYGQLGQIERIITEVPTVSMDFTYHLNGTVNETILLGSGANGSQGGFMKQLNDPSTNKYSQNFTVNLASEGTDYNNSVNHAKTQAMVIPEGHITSYAFNGAVGDVPSATVNLESTKMMVDSNTANSTAVAPENSTNPVVLRPGNVSFFALPAKDNASGISSNDPSSISSQVLPTMGFGNIHVQSFAVSVDIPRESIQRMGDRFEYARVITFPIQATMSIEAIVSSQTASKLEDIVGTDATTGDDPGQHIDIYCNRTGTSGVKRY